MIALLIVVGLLSAVAMEEEVQKEAPSGGLILGYIAVWAGACYGLTHL